MIILNSSDVRRALPMERAIQAMKQAYAALSTDAAIAPLRTRLPIAAQEATALFMPAFVPGDPEDALAVKVVTLFPHNPGRGLPYLHAAVLVMEAQDGRMLALIEGAALTAIRTGAGAGAATDLLARPDSRRAAIFGTGVQARTQLEAVCTVRPVEEARIYSPDRRHVEAFIAAMAGAVPARLVPAASPAEALDGADVVCTATTSTTPVFEDRHLMPGAHLNAVGSYTPAMVEIPPETVARAGVFVDSRAACAAEAGELIRAAELGLVDFSRLVEIGEVAAGLAGGRRSADAITLFKSVGVAVQDAAAARLALSIAKEQGLGKEVRW